jgi:hypothetical protein
MPSPVRLGLVAALAIACHGASAQTVVSPVLSVQRIAPQPDQIAQVLETARQRLIGLGISNPTAEQLALTLMGGLVPTPLGGSQVAGVLAPQNPPSPAVQVQSNAAAGATSPGPRTAR